MKEFTFLKVDMFNVKSGNHISYWPETEFETIKTIPEPTSDDDVIPDHIVVEQVVAVVNDNQSLELIVLALLNKQIVKTTTSVATWTKATGWVNT
jgi:hypothetical protein